MSQSNFLFYAAPADVPELCRAMFSQGVTCLAYELRAGTFQYFANWDEALASELERQGFAFLAGDFTVDVRRLSGTPALVDRWSGPLLNFRPPKVWLPFGGGMLANYSSASRDRPADGRVSFLSGLLNRSPQYSFRKPKGSRRDYQLETAAAFRHLQKALKGVMIEHKGKWLGMMAYEWAMTGPVSFL